MILHVDLDAFDARVDSGTIGRSSAARCSSANQPRLVEASSLAVIVVKQVVRVPWRKRIGPIEPVGFGFGVPWIVGV